MPLARSAVALMAAVLVGLLNTHAEANNTSGVFSPVVSDGDFSLQYRSVHDLDSDAFAHRVHAQKSIDGERRLRGVVQYRKTAESGNALDYVRGELLWQLTKDDSAAYVNGVRLDLTWREDDRPSSLNVNWTHQWTRPSEWRYRAILITDVQFSSNSASGVGLETRLNATRPITVRLRAGVEMFSRYGRTGDIASLNEQRHQAGPVVYFKPAEGWEVFSSALLGLNNRSPDAQIRFWLTRKF